VVAGRDGGVRVVGEQPVDARLEERDALGRPVAADGQEGVLVAEG